MAQSTHPRLGVLITLAALTLGAVMLCGPATAEETVRIIVTHDKDDRAAHHDDHRPRDHHRFDRRRFEQPRYGAPSFGLHFGRHFDRRGFDHRDRGFDRHRFERHGGGHHGGSRRSNHRANVPGR